MVMSASVITEQIATANSEMMIIPRYAHPHFAVPAQLSKHHSKLASPIAAERKSQFNDLDWCSGSSSELCLSFGQGIYTSSASNKYVGLARLNYDTEMAQIG